MRSVEGEGLTIDDAIARALAVLGAARDEVEIDILENASRGVFGIGRRRARVRATVRQPLRGLLDTPCVGNSPTATGDAARPPRETAARRLGAGDAARPREAVVSLPTAHRRQSTPIERAGLSADGAAILRAVLARMAFDASVVESEGGSGERVLRIEGPDGAAAIGQRGEVLDALEYLVQRLVERGGRSDCRPFVLEAAGFREQRKASLEEHARRLAERARRGGKSIATTPLNPADRRAVYSALKSESGITARTIGQGFYRKLVIIPEGGRRGGAGMRH